MNVQLIDTGSGAHLWADRFDTDRANLVEAQSEITGRLASTLNLELLRDASRRIEQEGKVDSDARDFVMRGWAWWYRLSSIANMQEALRAFERALEIDPRSNDARIGIARVLIGNLGAGWSSSSYQQDATKQEIARAEWMIFEAIRSDPNQSMAYAILGMMRRMQVRLAESRIPSTKQSHSIPIANWGTGSSRGRCSF